MTGTPQSNEPLPRGDVVSLHEHIEARLRSEREFNDAQIATVRGMLETFERNNNERLKKSDENQATRLALLNEWKEHSKERETHYFTRAEHEAYLQNVERDLRIAREFMAKAEGKASQNSVMIAMAFSLLGLALAAVGLFR